MAENCDNIEFAKDSGRCIESKKLNSSENVSSIIESGVEFTREIEVESRGIELKIHQYSVGDVGCVVWDAGIVLGKYLDHLQPLTYSVSGKSIIDIGSGTGITGLFAAALGANVILTDLPEVIPLLKKNIKTNKENLTGSAAASVLCWGEDVEKFSLPDVLLASDCIYYDMSVEKLIPTLVALSSESTDVFISYEDRDLGNKAELLRKFLEELGKSFDINVIPLEEQHPEFQSPDIHILKCKRKSNQQGG